MRCLVLSHARQRPAARIAEECVVYDYREGHKVPPAPWLRAVLDDVATEDAVERQRWVERRGEVESWVQKLETESIFSGKAEDFGSAHSR